MERTAIYGEPDPSYECLDCGTAPTHCSGLYCPYHARLRYRYPSDDRGKARARFLTGALPTHDDVIGKPWEAEISATARARAAQLAKYRR